MDFENVPAKMLDTCSKETAQILWSGILKTSLFLVERNFSNSFDFD
jgi:hypothetical protein